MSVFKNVGHIKKAIKIISLFLFKIYTSKKNKVDVPQTPSLPILFLISKQNLLYLNAFGTYSLVSIFLILLSKDLLNSATETLDFFHPPTIFPGKFAKKRILALHVCCPLCPQRSVNSYVVFKQKNKNNLSSVQVNRGEVGKIIEKLKGWDEALVDFSIEVPYRYQKLDTKSLVENVFNEGLVLFD